MDAKATADWKVNPAFHPEVNAFIEQHANNSGFVQKARGLQQNRAKFYAKVKGMEPAAAPAEAIAEAIPMEDGEVAAEAIPMDEGMAPAAMAEPISSPAATEPLPPTFLLLRRLAKITLVLLFLATALVLVASVGYRQYGKKQLDDASAETSLLDPNWQWESLVVNRAEVPEDQNAALVVLKAAKLKPQDLRLSLDLEGLLPREPISEENLFLLQQDHELAQPVLEEGKPLADLTTGRYPDPQAGMKELLTLAVLYQNEALLQAEENRGDLALENGRRLINVISSLGDDPDPKRQMVRIDGIREACLLLERVLARTNTSSDEALAALQERLASEISRPSLRILLRGERAQDFELQARPDAFEPEEGSLQAVIGRMAKPMERFLFAGDYYLQCAELLRSTTAYVRLEALPIEQLAAAAPFPSRGEPLAGDYGDHIESYLRYQAALRCAEAALACERYRLAHKAWPESLEQLVPQYLTAVPSDPYDGKPLRLQRSPEGMVIYSVGPNQTDDQAVSLGDSDVGFRLYDVDKRRQPTMRD